MSATVLLSEVEMNEAIRRIAGEIHTRHGDTPLAFIGIHTRGVTLCHRVAEALAALRPAPLRGTVDISLYRDDLSQLESIPIIKESHIPFPVDGTRIVLFDDVLFTGRTIRAALEEILDYGRPARIELAVLVDRGNRELPICADYVGLRVQTQPSEHIRVGFRETDAADGVFREPSGR